MSSFTSAVDQTIDNADMNDLSCEDLTDIINATKDKCVIFVILNSHLDFFKDFELEYWFTITLVLKLLQCCPHYVNICRIGDVNITFTPPILQYAIINIVYDSEIVNPRHSLVLEVNRLRSLLFCILLQC